MSEVISSSSSSPSSSLSMPRLRDAWLNAQAMRGKTPRSLMSRTNELNRFIKWCDARGIVEASQVSKAILERYRGYLFYYRKPATKDLKTGALIEGAPLSLRTQAQRLACLKTWFKWMTRQDFLTADPAAHLDLPKIPRALPKEILASNDVEKILHLPDVSEPLGLRDRAMLEVLYACGIRRMEVARLSIYDIHHERKAITIHEGKGRKDRVLPITDRALEWINKYLAQSRPKLCTGAFTIPLKTKRKSGDGTRNVFYTGYNKPRKFGSELPSNMNPKDALFLTKYGEPFEVGRVGHMVKEYIQKAEVQKSATCHTLRHSMATGMLNNGADIRFVQEMLGHASIATTQLYTHVSIEKLRQVYEATHPSRTASADGSSKTVDGRAEVKEPRA